jgi:hypothetical protein
MVISWLWLWMICMFIFLMPSVGYAWAAALGVRHLPDLSSGAGAPERRDGAVGAGHWRR